ncbi:MAG: T9SS type A sorting domain-containing protein [Calditrichota bacterium]
MMCKAFVIGMLVLLASCVSAQPTTPDTLWTQRLGSLDRNDWGMDVQQAADGGFLVLIRGDSDSNPGRVVKLTSTGQVVWEHISRHSGYDIITYRMVATPDNGCIYVGYDILAGTVTVKLDEDGEPVWMESFQGTRSIYFRFICLCEDGGCAVLSDTEGTDRLATILRYNSDGQLLWPSWFCYGDITPNEFTTTADGGFLIACNRIDNNAIAAIKFSAQGDSLWTRSVINNGTLATVSALGTTLDDGFIIGGTGQTQPPQYGGFAAKLDSNAQMQWIHAGYGTSNEQPMSLVQAENGHFFVTGYCSYIPGNEWDLWVAELDSLGAPLWTWYYSQYAMDYGFIVRTVREGGCIVAGVTTHPESGNDAFVVRLAASQPNSAPEPFHPTGYSLAQNYPNPFNASSEIRYSIPQTEYVRLSILNILGQEVAVLSDAIQSAGQHRVQWNGRDAMGNDLSSGIYLYRLETTSFQDIKKMILLR